MHISNEAKNPVDDKEGCGDYFHGRGGSARNTRYNSTESKFCPGSWLESELVQSCGFLSLLSTANVIITLST